MTYREYKTFLGLQIHGPFLYVQAVNLNKNVAYQTLDFECKPNSNLKME